MKTVIRGEGGLEWTLTIQARDLSKRWWGRLDMAGVWGKRNELAFSSGILTGLYCLEFDQVFWLVAIAMMLPHLQIEPLQVHCVLLCVEKRAADSLLPNTCSHHLQAKGDKENGQILKFSKTKIQCFSNEFRSKSAYYSMSEPILTAMSS